jgi:ElaA protein
MSEFAIGEARLVDVPPRTLYELLALRVDVFVVEQGCRCHELDGRDLEVTTRLMWAERDGAVVGTLRILEEGDGAVRIGRVATAVDARRIGVGAALMQRALDLIGDRPVVLAAQAHLADWYGRFGFIRDGEDFEEVGIDHTPMRLSSNL